jgi:hypothetical protein
MLMNAIQPLALKHSPSFLHVIDRSIDHQWSVSGWKVCFSMYTSHKPFTCHFREQVFHELFTCHFQEQVFHEHLQTLDMPLSSTSFSMYTSYKLFTCHFREQVFMNFSRATFKNKYLMNIYKLLTCHFQAQVFPCTHLTSFSHATFENKYFMNTSNKIFTCHCDDVYYLPLFIYRPPVCLSVCSRHLVGLHQAFTASGMKLRRFLYSPGSRDWINLYVNLRVSFRRLLLWGGGGGAAISV